MTTLLLLRHGTSVNNTERRFSGQYDTPLTERGRAQAAEAGEYIRKHYSVTAVYASDLTRARDTVTPVAQALGLPVTLDPALREVDLGDFTNQPIKEYKALHGEIYRAFRTENKRLPRGECWGDVTERAWRALRRIAAAHPDETVLIGTHGGVIRSLLTLWQGKEPSQIDTLPAPSNASLTVADYENGAVTVRLQSCNAYLTEPND